MSLPEDRYANAWQRHQKYVRDYVRWYGGPSALAAPSAPGRTDFDVLRDNYRFIRTEDDDDGSSWEKRLAKRYYDKLFREYCIGDLSRYDTGHVGLRWRTEKEVVSGKGQFVCGAKGCEAQEGLKSYEVDFCYKEAGERKQALVKFRVCPACAEKLLYRSSRRHAKRDHVDSSREAPHAKAKRTESPQRAQDPAPAGQAEAGEPVRCAAETAQAAAAAAPVVPKAEEAEAPEAPPRSEVKQATGDEWKKQPTAEKTRDDDFDDYFSGMFL
eukprot:m51a1_g8422 putative protein fra10ac1-like (270) ;mRNA; r:326170-327148